MPAAALRHPRGDRDDHPAAALEEVRDRGARQVGGGERVDPEGPLPPRVPRLVGGVERRPLHDRRVVHEHVDRPPGRRARPELGRARRLERGLRRTSSLRSSGIVADRGLGAPTVRVVVGGDVRAGAAERGRGLRADSLRCTGHEHGAPGEIGHTPTRSAALRRAPFRRYARQVVAQTSGSSSETSASLWTTWL